YKKPPASVARRSARTIPRVDAAVAGGSTQFSSRTGSRPRSGRSGFYDLAVGTRWRGSNGSVQVKNIATRFALLLAAAAVVPLLTYGAWSIVSLRNGAQQAV